MRLTDAFTLARQAVLAQRLRSFLTLLGIAVGIASVVLLTSIGEGIHRYVLHEFSQFGTNVVSVLPGKTKTGGAHSGLPTSARPLSLEDAEALRRIRAVTALTPIVRGNAEVEGQGRVRRTQISGVSADLPAVFNMRLQVGRFLPAEDVAHARAFVVLGSALKQALFGTANPLGARLRIGGLQFRVIGVMAPQGQFLGIDLDDLALIPTARAMELFNSEGVNEINLALAATVDAVGAETEIRTLLRQRHGHEDFTIITQAEMLKTLSNILTVLTLAVGALGSISLFVGGVGIATIMTIAVTERTREIGLLVALGATRRAVLSLFLGEAMVLSALGGGLGLILGFGLAQALHVALPQLPVHTPLVFVLLAEGIAVGMGLLAGIWPARNAARLDPVTALNRDAT